MGAQNNTALPQNLPALSPLPPIVNDRFLSKCKSKKYFGGGGGKQKKNRRISLLDD